MINIILLYMTLSERGRRMERDRSGVFRDSSRWWIFLNFPSADWRVCVCDETFTVCVAFFK